MYYTIRIFMSSIFNQIILFFFPAFCTACKALLGVRKALCNQCFKEIQPVVSTKMVITQKYQMDIYAVGAYQEPLRQLVLAKSYQDKLACYYMAQLMYDHISSQVLTADYLVPIPLHWTRYAQRGYNQSAEIARYLSQMSGIPVANLLQRTKRTPFQAQFDRSGRQSNVQDAFCLVQIKEIFTSYKHKRLILVDDVMTTGATLQVAAKVLLSLKPLSVKGVVLARTVQ